MSTNKEKLQPYVYYFIHSYLELALFDRQLVNKEERERRETNRKRLFENLETQINKVELYFSEGLEHLAGSMERLRNIAESVSKLREKCPQLFAPDLYKTDKLELFDPDIEEKHSLASETSSTRLVQTLIERISLVREELTQLDPTPQWRSVLDNSPSSPRALKVFKDSRGIQSKTQQPDDPHIALLVNWLFREGLTENQALKATLQVNSDFDEANRPLDIVDSNDDETWHRYWLRYARVLEDRID